MNATGVDHLSAIIAAEVKHVQGVSGLYSTRPVADAVIRSVVQFVTREKLPGDLITVTRQGLSLDVQICIGIASGEDAPTVSRRVWERVEGLLTTRGESTVRTISVKVGSVQ